MSISKMEDIGKENSTAKDINLNLQYRISANLRPPSWLELNSKKNLRVPYFSLKLNYKCFGVQGKQEFGSGPYRYTPFYGPITSAWIRIRIHIGSIRNTDPDPKARKLTEIYK
jgi:hypothetical protein